MLAGTGATVTYGAATGPSTDGLTAATFAGGQWLAALGNEALYDVPGSGTTPRLTLEAFVVASATATDSLVCHLTDNGDIQVGLRITGAGKVQAFKATNAGVVATITSTTTVEDGALHHVAVTTTSVIGASNTTLYVDGVAEGSGSEWLAFETVLRFGVGGGALPDGTTTTAFTGTIAHAAMFASTLSATRVAAHANAGLTGHAGERTDQRLLRILGWVGVVSTEVDTEVGAETMTHQLTSGQSVIDALRDVESTEGGVLFDGADGDVKFHNRAHRYQKTASATLNMASQHVGSDYAPRLDRSTLVNDVTVSNPTTEQTARATNTASSDEYGVATGSATSVANSYDPLQQKASWTVASYAEPRMRVPSLTVDVLAHVGLTPSAETLLGITVGDIIAVTNAPTQADSTSTSYFVEGYTETIGPESWFITFNLSPTYPTLNTFVLDDPVRGVLDAGNMLAL